MNGLSKIANHLSLKKYQKIGVMTGAGISVNAGIPDFRSKSGIYSKVTSPELIFDIHHFRKKPQDFYDLAPKIVTPDPSPTLTHYFISFLEYKNLLQICYSQNIDGLERKAGVTKIVQAHGNKEKAHCSLCYAEYNRSDLMIAMKKSTPIYCDCKGPIKPDVVFFGEPLPKDFEENKYLVKSADLLLIFGTSLIVQPFSSLIHLVEDIPRIVINNSNHDTYARIGLKFQNLKGFDPAAPLTDLIFQGDSDMITRKLLEETGWKQEFLAKFPTVQEW